MHKISDEFEFWSDWTTDYGVSCPWVSKKFPIDLQWENGVCMLAHSFLIKSSSKLLVTRTGIKARMSLISGLWFPWPIYMFLKWDLTLAHWTQVSDGCPLGYLCLFVIVHRCPLSDHRPSISYPHSSNISSQKPGANQSQVSYGVSLGWGNKCLFKWCWSHDQDICHAHMW